MLDHGSFRWQAHSTSLSYPLNCNLYEIHSFIVYDLPAEIPQHDVDQLSINLLVNKLQKERAS